MEREWKTIYQGNPVGMYGSTQLEEILKEAGGVEIVKEGKLDDQVVNAWYIPKFRAVVRQVFNVEYVGDEAVKGKVEVQLMEPKDVPLNDCLAKYFLNVSFNKLLEQI